MISKNSFWRLSAWNIKKRSWVLALSSLIWLLDFPVAAYIHINSILAGYSAEELAHLGYEIQYNLLSSQFTNGFHLAIVAALAILMALQGFDWINKKQKVDLYRSVPVKESARFWYTHLNSLFMFAIPYAVSLFLANLVIFFKGFYSRYFVWVSLIDVCIGILLFCGVYMVALIAVLLTGNAVLAFFGACFLLSAELICRFCALYLNSIFYKTSMGNSVALCFIQSITTPISSAVRMFLELLDKTQYLMLGQYVDNYYAYRVRLLLSTTEETWIKPMLLLVGQIILYTLAAYWLYKKRPAQAGGKSIVFRWAVPVIKAAIIFVGSFGAGMCMSAVAGDEFQYGLFGIILAALILHIVLNAILEGDFNEAIKKSVKTLPLTLVSGGIACIILLSYAFDWAGFDTYLPKEEELAGFEFYRYFDLRYSDIRYSDTRYSDLYDFCMVTDENAKKLLLSVMKEAIEQDRYRQWPGHDGYGLANAKETLGLDIDLEYEDANSFEYVTLVYHLKNGKAINRRYILSVNDARKIYAGIYELPEYKKLQNPLMSEKIKNNSENSEYEVAVSYTSYDFESLMTDSMRVHGFDFANEKEKEELISAVQKDIEDRTYTDTLKKAPIGNLEFIITVSRTDLRPDLPYPEGAGRSSRTYEIPVYECDERTIELIKKAGFYRENVYRPEMVSRLELSYDDGNEPNYGSEDSGTVINVVPDSEIGKQLMENAFGQVAVSRYAPDISMIAKYRYRVSAIGVNGLRTEFWLYKEGFPSDTIFR